MRLRAFFCLFMLPLLLAADGPEFGPKELVSKEGKFSVIFPEDPTETILPKPGGAKEHWFTLNVSGAFYSLSYHDDPKRCSETKDDLKDFLKKVQLAFQEKFQGRLANAKELTLDNQYPGREFEIHMRDSETELFRNRSYIVDGRVYMLVVQGTEEAAGSKEATEFLESFKLMK